MHDTTMMKGLLAAAERAAADAGLGSVSAVRVRIGALAGISPSHLAEHYEDAVGGTLLDGAELVVESGPDGPEALDDPAALGVLLVGIEGESA